MTLGTSHGAQDAPEPEQDLYRITPEDRRKLYRQYYAKMVEPLSIISKPDECDTWPDFADEIYEGYLSHTTFTVEVWPNYDTTNQRFYPNHDPRFKDTGILHLKQDAVKRFRKHDPGELRRVHFELSTPFKTLCAVTLRARPLSRDNPDRGTYVHTRVRPLNSYDDVVREHPRLISWVVQVCRELDRIRLPDGQKGFTLDNLVELAERFSRDYEDEDQREYWRGPWYSEWIDILGNHEEEQNDGFIRWRE